MKQVLSFAAALFLFGQQAWAQCTPAYVTGDRSASISASLNGLPGQGTPNNLVDGAKGAQGSTDNISFASGTTLNGTQWVQFDFGIGNSVKITEAKWYAEGPASQGTFKWQGSDDLSNWTDIGGSFSLTGSGLTTANTLSTLSGNTNGYRAYRMLGLSGSTDGSRWLAEIDFKQCNEQAQQTGRPLAIIVVEGQSNAEGQAPNPDQSVYANRARVKNFALDGTWKPAADPLMDTTGSLWSVLNNTSPATGPALSLGNALAPTLKNFDVGLVVSAKGSTGIADWSRSLDPATLYGAGIERAQQALASAPYGSFVAAFVWQQGEHETDTEAHALGWKPQVEVLFANVRSDLGLPSLPTMNIGLGPNPNGSVGWSVLNGVQQFMSMPPPWAFVSTNDLPNAASADWLNTTSVLTIGQRAARAMRPLLPPML